jgi:iron complex outermembrane receptor protein
MSFANRWWVTAPSARYCIAAALISGMLPAYAPAQEQEPETVVVTGSRIRQDPLNQAEPVITMTDEDIQRSGLTAVGDVLQRLAVSGGGLNTKFNTSGNIGFPPDGGGVGAGATTADLRHLGAKRVLILVDGVRWVNESSATGVGSATDLNTIPSSIIDHIEVLQDGASSVYGSDAIAGVINIITKKDYDGLEFSGYGGEFDESDGDTQQFSVSTGTKTDRTSAFVNLSYTNQDVVSSGDREISEFPTPGIGECTGFCSSGTPQGRFFFTDPNTGVTNNLTINDGVTGIPFYDPTQPVDGSPRTDDFHAFTTADRFNFQPFNQIMSPNKRVAIYGQAETALTDNVSFYLKGLFNNRKSRNQAAPEPIFIGPEAGNGGGSLLDVTEVDVNNPYNPFGFTLNLGTDPATGGTDYFIGRRPLEGGPRIFEQNVDTWYLGGGFDGNFNAMDRDFYWDVNAVWSRNHADQTTHGSYNSRKIQQALGPGGTDADGNLVCGEPDANGFVADPIPLCVPLNIFGGQGDGSGTITPEMLGFIEPVLHDTSEQELKDITANLTGTIVQMPAGGLDFAVGFEHRNQSGFYEPDQIYTSGESAGVPSGPTSGGFNVNEYYGELRVPILKGVPGADLLQLNAAVRSSDYSTFGSDTTAKYGFNWRPIEDLLFRGTFSEGLRAPGIGELFGTFSRFDTTLNDPCSDYAGLNGNPAAPQNVQDNCAALGVPADYQQFNAQISVITGGNQDLQPETSDGTTLGFVYSPRWAEDARWSDGLTFEVTYWKISIDNTIQARDAQAQIDGCVDTLDPVLCGGIARTSGGVINGFNNTLINIGGTDTKGYDLNVRWMLPSMNVGSFGISWQNTFLDQFTDTIPTASGFQQLDRKGTENGDPSQAWPEWKSTLTVDWVRGAWSAASTLRHTDSVTETCSNLQGLGLCSEYNLEDDSLSTNKMDAINYIDAQVNWAPTQLNGWTFTLGVNNLTDEDPPFCFSCALNSFDGSTYDIPGVFYYARAVVHFTKN